MCEEKYLESTIGPFPFDSKSCLWEDLSNTYVNIGI